MSKELLEYLQHTPLHHVPVMFEESYSKSI